MMRAYLNYPNNEIILHANQVCPDGNAGRCSSRTRQIDISPANVSQEIQRFVQRAGHLRRWTGWPTSRVISG